MNNIISKMTRAVVLLMCLFCNCNICSASKPKPSVVRNNTSGSISLQKIANTHSMSLKQVGKNTFSLSGNISGFIFTEGNACFQYNGQKLFLGQPPRVYLGSIAISNLDYQLNVLPFIHPRANHPNVVRRIVIDPGHGGKNFGTVSRGFNAKEKDLTLDIAKLLQADLIKCGYQVILTRDTDRDMDLVRRSDLANNLRSDLFISIHINHAESQSANGLETFYIAPNGIPSFNNHSSTNNASDFAANKFDGWNIILAYCVQGMLLECDSKMTDRGIKASRFAVLKNLNCPGILVECGFLSNADDCAKLVSRAYRAKLAESICRGIRLYDENLRRVMHK